MGTSFNPRPLLGDSLHDSSEYRSYDRKSLIYKIFCLREDNYEEFQLSKRDIDRIVNEYIEIEQENKQKIYVIHYMEGSYAVEITYKESYFEVEVRTEDGEINSCLEFRLNFSLLLNGKDIVIDKHNADYIRLIGESLDIEELKRKEPMKYIKTIPHVLTMILMWLSYFSRIVLSIWDLAGVAIIFSFVFNTIVLLFTSTINYLEKHTILLTLFFAIPSMIYSLFFINVMIIPTYEFIQFRTFHCDIIGSKIIFLICELYSVVFNKRCEFEISSEGQDLCKILLSVASIIMFASVISYYFSNGSSVMEYTLIIFACWIPALKYSAIIFLYFFHNLASFIPSFSKNFARKKDFRDPFLCSLYLFPNPFFEKDYKRRLFSFFRLVFVVYGFLILFVIFIGNTYESISVLDVVFTILFIVLVSALSYKLMFPWVIIKTFFGHYKNKDLLEYNCQIISDTADDLRDHHAHFNHLLIWDREYLSFRIISFCTTTIVFFWFFVLCLLLLFDIRIISFFGTDKSYNGTVSLYHSNTRYNDQQNDEYLLSGICAHTVYDIPLLDLAVLSHTTYFNETEANDMLDTFYGNNTKRPVEFVNLSTTYPDPRYKFSMTGFNYTNGSTKAIIFAIRGTESYIDMLVDIDLFAGSFLIKSLISFLPFVESEASSRYLVNLGQLMAIHKYVFRRYSMFDKYIHSFKNCIEQFINGTDVTGYDILITGHSLGGAISKILSMTMNIKAVSFSGPGVTSVQTLYTNSNYTFTQAITSTFVNVKPEHDIIANIEGFSSGTVFKVPCNDNFATCHYIYRTICSMSVMCNDLRDEYCRKFCTEDEYEKIKKYSAPVRAR